MGEYKPILCLDFDGVLHSYESGWKGAANIPDPPVIGAMAFIVRTIDEFDVQIYSSRSHQTGGIPAMTAWTLYYLTDFYHGNILKAQEALKKITWPKSKPPALITLDDRVVCFRGLFPPIEMLKNFKPWNKGAPDHNFTFVSVLRLQELMKAEKVLEALRAGGVDNWEWYEDSLEDIEDD